MRWPRRLTSRFVVVALCSAAAARAQAPPVWPDTFVARLEALALMQTLNADILASRSATASLEKWCRDHHMAEPPRLTAQVVGGVDKVPTAEQRQRLDVGPQDTVKYRRVQLRCGSHLLSEADNWYVPSRLTAEMNRQLESTDTPFGRAVEPLEPYRRTFEARVLWSPLPEGWERDASRRSDAANRPLAMPDALFEHHALLYTRDHKPFSEVAEVYQRHILDFIPAVVR